METTVQKPGAPGSWAVHVLLLGGLLGLLPALHTATHVVSALGRLIGRNEWIDVIHASTTLGKLFWIPPALLALGVAARNGMRAVYVERRAFGRYDLLIACGVALIAFGVRAAPLLADPWLKPEYDEGVYLGGAWLLRNGALPYPRLDLRASAGQPGDAASGRRDHQARAR